MGLIDIKPQLFDSMRKASPDINSVLKTGISSLSKSIKNPGQVNVQDIAKANSLLGKHGPETQQVASTFKQLTGWKAPAGSNDFTLPDLLTLLSPSLGDGYCDPWGSHHSQSYTTLGQSSDVWI